MKEVYKLGCCYNVTLEDGSKVVFRVIGDGGGGNEG